MERDVIFYGDPRLRKKCEEITDINDEIRQLAQDLKDTCLAHDGVGTAAPQLGILKRIFVTRFYVGANEDGVELEEALVCINPKLFDPSEESAPYPQGCLSIPEVYGEVVRPKRVTLEWTDLEGKTHQRVLHGINATIAMHENDHLNGVLFIDRLPPRERRRVEPLLLRVKKKYYKKK